MKRVIQRIAVNLSLVVAMTLMTSCSVKTIHYPPNFATFNSLGEEDALTKAMTIVRDVAIKYGIAATLNSVGNDTVSDEGIRFWVGYSIAPGGFVTIAWSNIARVDLGELIGDKFIVFLLKEPVGGKKSYKWNITKAVLDGQKMDAIANAIAYIAFRKAPVEKH